MILLELKAELLKATIVLDRTDMRFVKSFSTTCLLLWDVTFHHCFLQMCTLPFNPIKLHFKDFVKHVWPLSVLGQCLWQISPLSGTNNWNIEWSSALVVLEKYFSTRTQNNALCIQVYSLQTLVFFQNIDGSDCCMFRISHRQQ